MALEQLPLVFLRRTGPSTNQRYGYPSDDNPPVSSVTGTCLLIVMLEMVGRCLKDI